MTAAFMIVDLVAGFSLLVVGYRLLDPRCQFLVEELETIE